MYLSKLQSAFVQIAKCIFICLGRERCCWSGPGWPLIVREREKSLVQIGKAGWNSLG